MLLEHRMTKQQIRRGAASFLTAAVVLLSPALVYGQGFAVTGGANIDPDQMFVGGRYEWPLVENVWFQPGVDAGFGSGATLLAIGFDVTVRKALDRTPWTIYAGGGPALNRYRWDDHGDTQAGMNILGGLRHSNGIFTEFRAALADGPSFRFTIGYMLGSGATHKSTSQGRR
jgi:hypothetical protein